MVLAHAVVADLGLGHGGVLAAEEVLLRHPELGAGLDHVDGIDAACHGGESLDGPQHVVHQRAAAGSDLDQLDGLALAALGEPLGHEPDGAQLAKDLRDLGRGDEVALEAELVTAGLESARVVAANVGRQAHAHVAGQRDGAGCLGGE